MKDFFALFWRGILMGAADLIPGVSGGTMAFILGIYERFMNALKSLNGDALYHFLTFKWKLVMEEVDFKTLFGVGCGILFGIAFFVYIVALPAWVEYYKPQVYGFFFGLVFATVILFLTQQKSAKFMRLLTLLAGTAAGVGLTMLNIDSLPNTKPFIFLSGMVAICAMLLPGVSGSYILLMLGKYELILQSLATFHWPVLGVFMLGLLCGMLAFVRVLSWLLSKYHDTMLMFITGLIAGTLPQLWPIPMMHTRTGEELGIVALCMVGGIVFIMFLNFLKVRLSD